MKIEESKEIIRKYFKNEKILPLGIARSIYNNTKSCGMIDNVTTLEVLQIVSGIPRKFVRKDKMKNHTCTYNHGRIQVSTQQWVVYFD